MPLLSIQQHPIIDPGGGAVIRALANNSQRAYYIVSGRTTSNLCLCLSADGFDVSQFWVFATGLVNQWFRRRDLGELVTHELYLTDLLPVSPQCDIVITEGIIIPGS